MYRRIPLAAGFFSTLLLLGGCQTDRALGAPIVDMKGVSRAQYEADLVECRQYADEVEVRARAAGGAAAGAAVGAVIGAVVGDSGTAQRGAGVGAVSGGARGTVSGLRERQRVVKNCLSGRGYKVLN